MYWYWQKILFREFVTIFIKHFYIISQERKLNAYQKWNICVKWSWSFQTPWWVVWYGGKALSSGFCIHGSDNM